MLIGEKKDFTQKFCSVYSCTYFSERRLLCNFLCFCCFSLKLLLNQERFLNIATFHILTVDNKESGTFTWTQDGFFSWNLLFIL